MSDSENTHLSVANSYETDGSQTQGPSQNQSQDSFEQSFATPFRKSVMMRSSPMSSASKIPVMKRNSAGNGNGFTSRLKKSSGSFDTSHPMSWMDNDDELDEEWISEGENKPDEESDLGGNSQTGTTKHATTNEKVMTPEWKRQLNGGGAGGGRAMMNSSLEKLFRPPTVKEKEKLDSIPESVANSNTHTNTDTTRTTDQSHSFQTSQSLEEDDDDSRGVTSSPLKVFQKHDTFTNSRYDGLLGSLDNRTSADASNSSIVAPKRKEVTTQDYMNNADALFNKLKGLQPSGSTERSEHTASHHHHPEETEEDFNETTATDFTNNSNSSLNIPQPSSQDNQKKRPALIQPQDVQGIIPENFGLMDFDRNNMKWRRKIESDYNTGSTKVGGGTESEKDEKDVFEGIEDLSDGSTLEGSATSPRNQIDLDQFRESRHNIEPRERRHRELDDEPSELRRDPEDGGESLDDYDENENEDLDEQEDDDEGEDIQSDVDESDEKENFHQEGGFAPFKTPQPMRVMIPSSSGKREVSFRIPNSTYKSSPLVPFFNDYNSQRSMKDVTNISQIEASFSNGYSTLVKVLTDMGRNDPAWDQYDHLDLSTRGLETLVKLDEICPALKSLDITDNEISFVTGAPETLRSMIAAKNQLTDLASFGKLMNLQYLSLAENRYERLNGLAGLCHLRELNVDSNFVMSLDGISNLEGLLRLSCRNNQLTKLDFTGYNWKRMEDLVLDGNQITSVKGLEVLPSLSKLSLNNNALESIECKGKHKRLRKLSVKNNKLEKLDVYSTFSGLREIIADDNCVQLIGAQKLHNLEVISLRGSQPQSDWSGFVEVKRLYISGTLMNSIPMNEPFLNLQTLELSKAGLRALPPHFSEYTINIRELNLAFNKLSSITPLVGIPKLKRLYLYKNELDDMEHIIDTISAFDDLAVLDLRANPLTARFYPQLINPNSKSIALDYIATRTRSFQNAWALKDEEFEQTLPKALRQKRAKYQALVWGASTVNGNSNLAWLDGSMINGDKRVSLLSTLEQ